MPVVTGILIVIGESDRISIYVIRQFPTDTLDKANLNRLECFADPESECVTVFTPGEVGTQIDVVILA